jgi:hypothetical protein
MEPYKFETDQFGLSDTNIHLLRSRFNYKTIPLSSVQKLSIVRGKQVNNWLVLLFFGLALTAFGLFTAFKVIYEYFFANNYHQFYIQQFVIPILPLFAGLYCIYNSLISGPVLFVTTGSKMIRLPIKNLEKKVQVDDLIVFLKSNVITRNVFDSNASGA